MATPNGNGTNGHVGKVVQIIGPVLDVEFGEKYLPPIYQALRITSDGFAVPAPTSVIAEWRPNRFVRRLGRRQDRNRDGTYQQHRESALRVFRVRRRRRAHARRQRSFARDGRIGSYSVRRNI